MQEFSAPLKPINVGQLDGEMRAAFGKRYQGLSTDQKTIRFFVDDDLSKEDQAAVEAVYEAHTPTETDEQAVERKQRNRKDAYAVLRQFKRADILSLADALPYLEAVVAIMVDG